ncbi:MAG: hypothetical protein IPG97_16005 [Microthrixaceae bacterium]|nr:hypothetical protein [Microthrixaceae bacterium]
MTADVAPWLITLRDSAIAVGAVAGALVTIAAAAKLPLISRPIRWLWAHLVADPLATWIDTVLDPHTAPLHDRLERVEHEVRTNDGSSLRDVADRTEVAMARLGNQIAIVSAGLDVMIRTEYTAIRSVDASIAGRVDDIARHTDTARRGPDIAPA